jgi:hypothetical protein
MSGADSRPDPSFFILAITFLIAILIGLYLARGDLIPFFMLRPWINGAILAFGIVGLVLALVELLLIAGQHGAEDPDPDIAEYLGVFVRYLLGVMVFLGLIGTFWGLLITVSGVKEVLATLEPAKIDDPATFLVQLKGSMGGMLGGMSTAFCTSLFGLGGAVILGLFDTLTRMARARLPVEETTVASELGSTQASGQALAAYHREIRNSLKPLEQLPDQMNKLIDEMRLSRKSSEDVGKDLRELQSETTDKFANIISETNRLLVNLVGRESDKSED